MFERPNQRPASQRQPMESPRGGQGGRSPYLNWGAGRSSRSHFLRESGCGSPRAMEGDVLGEDALLQKLRDSRRRFQRHMQRLLEKVRPPPARWEGREAGGEGEDGVGDWAEEKGGGEGRWGPGGEAWNGEGGFRSWR